MKLIKSKFLWLTLAIVTLSLSMQSCDEEYYYDYDEWIAGRTFAAYAQPGSYNEMWIADFYWDGQFCITPCDRDGYPIRGMEIYEGEYTVDYDRGRIFLSYYGYSMNSMWTFTWWDRRDPYTGTFPDMEIYTTSGYGPLDNLVFTPY